MKLLKNELYKFKIIEIFRSIEGEGRWVGLPVVFVRLEGCNLRCSWCDTTYSYDGKSFIELDLESIVEKVKSYGIKRVCITGGEPFFNENLHILVKKFIVEDLTVFIETNGTLWNENLENLDWSKIYITCSPKPPFYFVHKKLLPHISELKFVIDENIKLSDIFKADYINILKNDTIVLQPESNKREMIEKALTIQNDLLKVGVESRIIPQCHKVLNLP